MLLTANQETFLKRKLAMAADLPPEDKMPIQAGQRIDILGYCPVDAKNGKVVLKAIQGEWYIFLPHWKGLPQNTAVTLATELIKQFEGCILYPYNDGVGIPTIGWGSTRYFDGRAVRFDDEPISQRYADQMLERTIIKVVQTLAETIPGWNTLSSNQQAALISFSYNVGESWYNADGFNSISRVITQRRYVELPSVLMLYVNPGTETEQGLIRRRVAEGKLWSEMA